MYYTTPNTDVLTIRYPARQFNEHGEHTGPGPWLNVIWAINRTAQAAGDEGPFRSPTSTGPLWSTPDGFVENYDGWRVIHFPSEDVVIIAALTDENARTLVKHAKIEGA